MTLSRYLCASALALTLALPARAADPELLVLDWAGFEVEGLFAAFKEKYGDGPTYTFFGSDDEAFQKAASGFKADVVHPCAQMVSKYREAGLIEPWDVSKIPDFAKIDPKFLNSPVFQDEGGVWYIPTDWGVTAIAYNTDEVPPEDVKTLQVFADPKYAGRISLPNSSDDVWALAYLATGITDWTAITDEQFAAAADWLRKVHPNVRSYWNDPAEMSQIMASGEVLIAWSWNDGVAYLKDDNYPVGFEREPKEGSSTWFCGMINVKDGPGNEDKAYDFVNSWLRDDAAPALIDAIGYGHSNVEAMAKMDQAVVEDAGLGVINAPILPQVPNDNALRERQLAEFEKIKAGF
jgi:spermidine/putrescine transport system substrate-binding protein